MLAAQPAGAAFTTGDGRTPLHVLSLCEDSEARQATLRVILRYATDPARLLAFQEPFEGNTALHAAAKQGHAEVVVRLLEAGAELSATNEAGCDGGHFLSAAPRRGGDAFTAGAFPQADGARGGQGRAGGGEPLARGGRTRRGGGAQGGTAEGSGREDGDRRRRARLMECFELSC